MKFLFLNLFNGVIKHRIVLGSKVDVLWHYFVLNTKEYRKFCNDVYGHYLNHFPMLPSQKELLKLDYQKTRILYEEYFGKPSDVLWANNDQICWGGDDNVEISTIESAMVEA